MNLLLVASSPLHPYCERLIGGSPHTIELVTPARRFEAQLKNACGYDAIVIADGAVFIPQSGLMAGEIPLVLPRVHNGIALLMGGAAIYRGVFERYNGAVCWMTAETARPLHPVPLEDCTCIGCLIDTGLGLKDNSLRAREIAAKNGWDYFSQETDPGLLRRLIKGEWDSPEIVTVPAGGSVSLTFRQDLFA